MARWNNDYNMSAHPQIIEALSREDGCYAGYGTDEWCERAKQEISKHLGNADASIHFMVGGTQTNYIVIAAALRSYQGIISATTGHIAVHETGAVENSGHKVITVQGDNGKLNADIVRKIAKEYYESGAQEHIVQPKMVFASFPSEYGTIYTKQELEDIRAVCDEYKMYLYVDGARLGYGLAAKGCDVTIEDLARLSDAFYIGGTKCGAMFGEAVVLINDDFKEHFRSYIKQNGAMLAKGWLLGLQYYTLFKDGLYFDITNHAVKEAMRIKDAFSQKGIKFAYESFTNQQFVIVNNAQMQAIGKSQIFEYDSRLDDEHHIIRFCTSWSTKSEDVDKLIEDIKNVM